MAAVVLFRMYTYWNHAQTNDVLRDTGGGYLSPSVFRGRTPAFAKSDWISMSIEQTRVWDVTCRPKHTRDLVEARGGGGALV
eukprot:2337412-Rhodomonas_salina.1